MANRIDIVGAGLAGLIAGNMLAHRRPIIFEQQAAIPNNHSAVLRFRSSIVGDVTGIPLRKVTMKKYGIAWLNPAADTLSYSLKCVGQMRSDRSYSSDLIVEDRYIAPDNLVYQLATKFTERTGNKICVNELYGTWRARAYPIISTVPMPVLMDALDYPHKPQFSYQHGINIRAQLSDCDAYISVLVPDPKLPYTRISITGNELIVELPRKVEALQAWVLSSALALLNIDAKQVIVAETIQQRYAKIMPIDDDARRQFLHWATDKHNIYSVGRFACWRPGLLLDDIVNDVRKIDRWIGADKYAIAQAR